MVLAVEIGNTHISLGGFDGDDCKFVAPIATAPKRTGVEIAWELKGVFSLFGLQANQFHAAIVGSVVPTMTAAVIQLSLIHISIALMETGEYVQWTLEFHKPVKEPVERQFSLIGYIMVVLGVYAPSEELLFNNVEMGYQLEWFSDPYKYEEIIELMHGLSNTVPVSYTHLDVYKRQGSNGACNHR